MNGLPAVSVSCRGQEMRLGAVWKGLVEVLESDLMEWLGVNE